MTQKDIGAKDPAPEKTRVPAHLDDWSRWVAGVFGCALLVTGIIAVFVVDRDWGPVALVIIGSLLFLAALVGKLPYVKWGDKEFDYSSQVLQAVELLESPADERAQKLDEIAGSLPPPLASVVRSVSREIKLMDVVRLALPRHVSVSEGIKAKRRTSDASLIDSTGKKLAVEIVPEVLLGSAGTMERALSDFRDADDLVVGGLLLCTRPFKPEAEYTLREAGWEPVLVGGGGGLHQVEAIRDAVSRAFTRAALAASAQESGSELA